MQNSKSNLLMLAIKSAYARNTMSYREKYVLQDAVSSRIQEHNGYVTAEIKNRKGNSFELVIESTDSFYKIGTVTG